MSIFKKATATHVNLQIAFDQLFNPATQIQKLIERIDAQTESIDVAFYCIARKIPPSNILALRTALLMIRPDIRLRTIAMTSLSPFVCSAWLVGNERWISSESSLWIPQLGEEILRGHPRNSCDRDALLIKKRARPTSELNTDEPYSDSYKKSFGPFFSLSEKRKEQVLAESHNDASDERECGCNRCRTIVELKSLASSINDWFPCWEYSGLGIVPEDLVTMNIIKPEWIFGTQSSERASARTV
ncbi:MAG: hypothetical protein RIS92_1866 [Verrucomicrobiota bacterium]